MYWSGIPSSTQRKKWRSLVLLLLMGPIDEKGSKIPATWCENRTMTCSLLLHERMMMMGAVLFTVLLQPTRHSPHCGITSLSQKTESKTQILNPSHQRHTHSTSSIGYFFSRVIIIFVDVHLFDSILWKVKTRSKEWSFPTRDNFVCVGSLDNKPVLF
jgi:hypothetical protein